jgi:hypothetical protein|tara:strand:- start:499 stop:1152 length:654 start_codon:yes stop_codon:yes gene_type:complete
MKGSLLIPNNLGEITLKQYQKYLKIQEKNVDPYFLQCKMIEIFCNLDGKTVRLLNVLDANRIVNILNKMFEDKPRLIRTFTIGGIEYGLIPQLDDMSLGEYIDLDTNIGNWDNMLIAMNVLFRPIKQKIGEKYLIKEYDIDTTERLTEIPIDIVLGAIFFLHNLGIELSKVMMDYLEQHRKDSTMHQQIFQENGDGIKAFSQDSLKEILQDLNISLN